MKRRRHVLGGLLLIVAGAVIAPAEWSILEPYVVAPLAFGLAAVGVANLLVGIGRPAVVRGRRDAVETVTAIVFALLGVAITVENALAPDGPESYLLAGLWGAAAVFTGWVGVSRVRSFLQNE